MRHPILMRPNMITIPRAPRHEILAPNDAGAAWPRGRIGIPAAKDARGEGSRVRGSWIICSIPWRPTISAPGVAVRVWAGNELTSHARFPC
jgi:hypothetical protein